jgi:hypothetical protein
MTASDLMLLLRKRFAPPEYAFFSELNSSVGFRARRTADAVAMQTWPSRGLELWGFEIKADRRDWLRELDQPEKAEVMVSYCDRWFVVVPDDSIVRDGELPPTWGLMMPRGKQGLVASKEAPKLEPKPWDKSFIAALLRRAATSSATAEDLAASKLAGYEEGHVAGVEEARRDRNSNERDYKEIMERVHEFDAATGLSFRYLYDIKTKGAGIKYFLETAPAEVLQSLIHNQNTLMRLVDNTRGAINELEKQLGRKVAVAVRAEQEENES